MENKEICNELNNLRNNDDIFRFDTTIELSNELWYKLFDEFYNELYNELGAELDNELVETLFSYSIDT